MRTETRAAATALTLLLAAALAGCTSVAPAPTVTATTVRASASRSASPAILPLGCDDLASDAEIAAALHGAASTVRLTSAPDASVVGARSIEGAGGLSCSWSDGTGTAAAPAPLLTASVLPGAAADWSAVLFGDGPSASRRTFAGVSAAADCGDPGCGASMVVGSAWVRVDLLVSGLDSGASPFGMETTDQILAGARPAIESVIGAVRNAPAARLRFAAHPGATADPAGCARLLPTGALASAMGTSTAAYDTRYQATGAADSIVGAAEHRIGVLRCFAKGSGSSPDGIALITIAPGQAWAVSDLAGDAAARAALAPVAVPGLAAGDLALSDCGASGNQCTVVLRLGADAVQIEDTSHPLPIAKAILASRG